MPTYKIEITGTLIIDAENVMQAKHVAKRVKLVGQHGGGRRPIHNRDIILHNLKIESFKMSNPKRICK